MIDYTPTARRHVNDLIAHYKKIRRPEAIRNMHIALARVAATIEAGSGRPRDFPRHIPRSRPPRQGLA
ncbi:MAG: hypothetical protein WDN04_26985 [Rhodospirillales bacterium]